MEGLELRLRQGKTRSIIIGYFKNNSELLIVHLGMDGISAAISNFRFSSHWEV
jgi:hypothetical protein